MKTILSGSLRSMFRQLLLLILASHVSAQMDIHTAPGIAFPGITTESPSLQTLEWIRHHRPKYVRTIGKCRLFSDSVNGYYAFSYPGDTLVIIDESMTQGTTVYTYDGRDTLRSREWTCHTCFKKYTTKEVFDSCGRKTLELNDDNPGPRRWVCKDDGSSLRISQDRYLTVKYFGPGRRVDSVLEFDLLQHGKGRKKAIDTIMSESVHYKYGGDNRPQIDEWDIGQSIQIDSLFYRPDGVLSRVASYSVQKNMNSEKPDSLYFGGVKEFDVHRNITLKIEWRGERFGDGGSFDTTRCSYRYDAQGRLTDVVSNQSYSKVEEQYEWGDDDRILDWKTFDESGKLNCDVHFSYEF